MQRRLCRLFPVAAFLSLTLLAIPAHAQGKDLQQHLRDQHKGKILVLRSFYDGDSLSYDSAGQLSGSAASGDWTIDGMIQVDDVRVSNHRLSIQAKRLHMGWVHDSGFSPVRCPEGKLGKLCEEKRKLRIEADLGPGEATADNAEAMLARIFVTQEDHFVELVPDYWMPCVLAAVGDKPLAQYAACQFSPEFLAVPGLAPHSDSAANADSTRPDRPGSERASSPGLFHIGRGVSPPKVIVQHEPEFSEPARMAKFQGVVTLGLVVDASGLPTNIRILKPLGCGLDEKAVHAVQGWRFKPAEKDGQPVAAGIAVEVDFHLY